MNEAEIAQAQADYEMLRPEYEAFADALRVLLGQLITDEGIEIESISARAKDVPSLGDKLRDKSAEYRGLDDVVDKCGLRIVTRYHVDVERTCALLQNEFAVKEIVDHGAEDIQSFGYASLHLVVQLDRRRKRLREWKRFEQLDAEIQVRSILQHAWASISHGLDYKTGAEVPKTVRRTLFRVAALLETGDELFDSFRLDVERLKSGYREDVARDDWRKLSLDHDSLLAAWDRLPMRALVGKAQRSGWYRVDAKVGDEAGRRSLGHLISVAKHSGIATLGELEEAMHSVLDDEARLRAFARLGTKRGFTPVAVAPDVVALALLSRDSRGRIARLLRRERRTYVGPLMEAAAELASKA